MNISSGTINCYLTGCGGKYLNVQKDKDFLGTLSLAADKVERQLGGEIIGFSTIIDQNNGRGWIMQAKYAECSIQDNPVIYVGASCNTFEKFITAFSSLTLSQ